MTDIILSPLADLDVPRTSALPADRNPALVYLVRMMTPKSKRAMRNALLLIVKVATGVDHPEGVEAFPWHQLHYQHCMLIRGLLNDYVSPETKKPISRATVNHALCALRGVVHEAYQLGLIGSEEYTRICGRRALPTIKGSSLPAGRYVHPEEMQKLFAHAGDGAIGARNAALLAVMFGCGLRLAEVAGLDMKDCRHASRELFVRGKGHKQRLVPMPGASHAALRAWLQVRGDAAGFVFQAASDHKGTAFKASLAEGSFSLILAWIAKRAGVANLTSHDTRRTFVSNIIDETGDISIAATLAGHESIETTKRYDRRPETAKRAAVDKLIIPYVG